MVKKIRRNRFADKLKALRKDAGLNQIALAQILGVTQVTVSLYESGRREPDLDDLMTIAERLNTTPNDLLGFTPPTLRDSAPPRETKIRTGDNSPVVIGGVNGNGNIVGSNINYAPPQSTSPSTSPSTSTTRKRKAKG